MAQWRLEGPAFSGIPQEPSEENSSGPSPKAPPKLWENRDYLGGGRPKSVKALKSSKEDFSYFTKDRALCLNGSFKTFKMLLEILEDQFSPEGVPEKPLDKIFFIKML